MTYVLGLVLELCMTLHIAMMGVLKGLELRFPRKKHIEYRIHATSEFILRYNLCD